MDYWDIDEMANQITAVMQNDALRDELRNNAYREYERMSWHTVSDKVKDLYHAHRAEVVA